MEMSIITFIETDSVHRHFKYIFCYKDKQNNNWTLFGLADKITTIVVYLDMIGPKPKEWHYLVT